MSVIAKMYVQKSGQVPAGALVSMSCVYDADLSVASNEDVRFTQASPWGEANFEAKQGFAEQSQWYLMFHDELPSFEGARGALKVRCHCVHDYGGNSKQVEISTAYDQAGIPEHALLSNSKSPSFHLKMSIDNPGASIQFVPGKIYYLTLYYAGQFTMGEVIAMARAAVKEPADGGE